ncbi:MAG: hypothetical protein V1780_05165 [Chloroflexota bacterium]
MRWFVKGLVTAGALLLIGFSGLVLYNTAYSRGQATGYSAAAEQSRASFEAGQTEGYRQGYEIGYSYGQQDGYVQGFTLGKDTGYQAGYEDAIIASLGHGYPLRDPTYDEAVQFLHEDRTNQQQYAAGLYSGVQYARDVVNNAVAEGYRTALLLLTGPDKGQAVVAFDTIDQGLRYFEPQNDEPIAPAVGQPYNSIVVNRIDIIW